MRNLATVTAVDIVALLLFFELVPLLVAGDCAAPKRAASQA
ncbi:hypothetical protein ACDH50_08610 [Xanthomonas fragariae]|nr:hypothetical protein [Xanthomonas fragariae]